MSLKSRLEKVIGGYPDKVIALMAWLWTLPTSLLASLLIAASAGPKKASYLFRGIVVVQPRYVWWFPKRFAGMVLGRVIIVRNINWFVPESQWEQAFVRHELHHCEQGLYTGWLHLPLYLLCCLMAGVCYGKPYRANWFEMTARLAAGQEVRP